MREVLMTLSDCFVVCDDNFVFYCFELYHFMRIKCERCSHNQDIAYDSIIFDDKDEKVFVSYLAAEMVKSEDTTE